MLQYKFVHWLAPLISIHANSQIVICNLVNAALVPAIIDSIRCFALLAQTSNWE